MTQQTSPFLDVKYGWAFGESGWNPGMDENLLKFSCLFDGNIDGVVGSLPAAVNGKTYFLTTDNRLYYAIGTTYFSTPVAKWGILTLRSSGQTYQFNGTSLLAVASSTALEGRLSSVEGITASLKSAAFEDTTFFASKSQLDVAIANAGNYTDLLRSDLISTASGKGSNLLSYNPELAGSTSRTVKFKLSDTTSVKDFGAVGDGITDDSEAIRKAVLAKQDIYFPEGTYYCASKIPVVRKTRFWGHGAILKGLSGGTAFTGRLFEVTGSDVTFEGLEFQGNTSAYSILASSAERTSVVNCKFNGNIGVYILAINCTAVKVIGNSFDGNSATVEISTCVSIEGCTSVVVANNSFYNVLVGWGCTVTQSSSSVTIIGNTFSQFRYSKVLTATAGQTVFVYTMDSDVRFKGIQIDGLPLSKGYTITNTGLVYTVTFSVGRSSGELVSLVGYRGAENIQLNTNAFDITVTGNTITGTGDSGIVCLADRVTISGNIIKNAGYAGIAVYGDQSRITITGNLISDCSQLDDGQSSPDNPALSSVFTCGILLSGPRVSVTGNTIVNDSGTMLSGIRVNKQTVDDFTSDKTVKIGNNTFVGNFSSGKILILNDTSGSRIQSVLITDGLITSYPEKINLDGSWTNAPINTSYYSYSGFGATIALRDTTIKQGGVASLKTVAGEYLDINFLASGIMTNTIIKVDFIAKNNSGSSYVSAFTTLAGLSAPVTTTITNTDWKQYTLLLPLTPNLGNTFSLRIGSNTGFANFQYFDISMIRV